MYIGIRSASVWNWLYCTVYAHTHYKQCARLRVCLRIQTFKNVLYTLSTVSGVFKCSTFSDFVFVLTSYLTQMDGELCHQILTFMHEHIQYGIRHGFTLALFLYFFWLNFYAIKIHPIHIYIHYIFIFIHAHMPAH